ncbi:MAG: hypothetical protein ACI87W_000293 [Halieaceae bacterium]|jgi:hypothetical protein
MNSDLPSSIKNHKVDLPILPIVIVTLMSIDPNDDDCFFKLLALAQVEPGLGIQLLQILPPQRQQETYSHLEESAYACRRSGAKTPGDRAVQRPCFCTDYPGGGWPVAAFYSGRDRVRTAGPEL